jgi:hypothetical protein
MRDRSWGIRRPHRRPKVGYDHATASADDGFLSISVDRKGDDRVLRGYLLRDGQRAHLVDGTRTVERDDECRPARITIDAVDDRGRTLHAVGEPVSRCVFNSYPHMFNWTSFTRWEFDGVEAWARTRTSGIRASGGVSSWSTASCRDRRVTSVHRNRSRGTEMKTRLACPCGEMIRGDDEDDLVEKAFAHLREKHPDLADEYQREHILFMAY